MEWLDNNTIMITPPKNPKKLTATRFATVLGLNPWSTPFEVWCEITRTYQKPFEETIYTAAGKTIEPKQAQYMKDNYFMSDLVSPAETFGQNYFEKTHGDFFPTEGVLGGMWDYLRVRDGKPYAVLEMKTTKRIEDWAEDVPEYYALQAALYAWLLDVDEVIMVASFLTEKDYKDPSKYKCSVKNTIIRPFNVWERYPDFEVRYIRPALDWWFDHVVRGLSPAYDEKRDAEILKVLRTNTLSPQTDLSKLVAEAEELKAKLDRHAAEIADDEKRYKVVCEIIKQAALREFRDGDKKVSFNGSRYSWEISRSVAAKINKDALSADGLLEKYQTYENTYRLTPKERKEEK